jgi:prolyl oligopeptidase
MAGLHYPDARRLDLAEDLFGHVVHDPYRWLEDPGSAETQGWLAAQDSLFAQYTASVPGRDALAARITELMRSGTVGAPMWRGERQFFMRRTADQDHSVLFTAAPAADGESAGEAAPALERVLIDPMAIDPTGLTTLDAWQPDKEGELLAYQLSQGGDEESLVRVMDVATGQVLDGPIDRCRYSVIAWLPGASASRGPYGKAFYYVRRLAPGTVPEGEEQYHRRVYLHRVGTPASEDVLIFGGGKDKTSYYGVSVSRDGHWLVITAALGTAPRNDVWLADLTATGETAPKFQVVQEGVDARSSLIADRNGRLYVFTNAGAPRNRLAIADPADPGPASWRDLIPERAEAVLTDFAVLDGPQLQAPVLLAGWKRHAISEVTVHDLATGEQTGTLPLPGLGSIGGITERPEGGHEAWFGYTDNTAPVIIYHYDGRTGELRQWARAPGSVEIPQVRTEQVTYKSKDGTAVRMLVISGGGEAQGPRPAILYGYGGFGISMTPAYSATVLAWVEAGGVYAIASLRGGSEEGEQWHRAGMREHKQRVFDDFHAAAEWLISSGLTTPSQLAVYGGSNGGLLVGAAITQRPELYAAALCSAPLLDMVRYERFGLGELWTDEYGTAADPEQLGWLLSYSPYHHVTDGTAYPATLFTVYDSDSRVDLMHARKMCAALQHAAAPEGGTVPADRAAKPVLFRRESSTGHAARAVSRSVSLAADTLAFAALHTGHPGTTHQPD